MKKLFLSMKTKQIIALMMALAMLMMSLAACGGTGSESADSSEPVAEESAAADTITLTDHADKQVEVPAEINKIVVCDIFPIPSVLAVFFDSAEKIVGMPEPSKTAA